MVEFIGITFLICCFVFVQAYNGHLYALQVLMNYIMNLDIPDDRG